MNGPARTATVLFSLMWLAIPTAAQMTYRPSPAPTLTAEAEEWLLAGEPLTHAGHIYFPAGPRIHFIPNEMVQTGVYRGIPVYARTTIEPLSVVFVPIGRGVMQPYERRRNGDLAGTVGSQAPSFPVTRDAEQPAATLGTSGARIAFGDEGRADERTLVEEPTATTGRVMPPMPVPRQPKPPGKTDGIFIMFEGDRWYSSGLPERIPTSALTHAGEHHGVPIYRRQGDTAIYRSIDREPGGLLARYERRP